MDGKKTPLISFQVYLLRGKGPFLILHVSLFTPKHISLLFTCRTCYCVFYPVILINILA